MLNLISRQEHSHDRQGHQPIASAHDRGHDNPQARAEDPGILHPRGQGLQYHPWLPAGPGECENLRRYQLHLASGGISIPSQNAGVTPLRFFFTVTLGRGEVTERMPSMREPRKLPVVLSPEEVARFLEARPQVPGGAERGLRRGLARQ